MGINDFAHPRYMPATTQAQRRSSLPLRLAALDVPAIVQAPKLPVKDIWGPAGDHIVAEEELVGTYER